VENRLWVLDFLNALQLFPPDDGVQPCSPPIPLLGRSRRPGTAPSH
jgi:hypothetical protein